MAQKSTIIGKPTRSFDATFEAFCKTVFALNTSYEKFPQDGRNGKSRAERLQEAIEAGWTATIADDLDLARIFSRRKERVVWGDMIKVDNRYWQNGALNDHSGQKVLACIPAYHGFNRLRIETLSGELIVSAEPSDETDRKFLIVDEFQTLPPAVLRELFKVQEDTGMALILSGNNKRLAKVRRKDEEVADEQNISRMGGVWTLPKPQKSDADLFAAEYNVKGTDAHRALANYGIRTNYRALSRLIMTARDYSGDSGSIRLEHLTLAAIDEMDGGSEGRRLAQRMWGPSEKKPDPEAIARIA